MQHGLMTLGFALGLAMVGRGQTPAPGARPEEDQLIPSWEGADLPHYEVFARVAEVAIVRPAAGGSACATLFCSRHEWEFEVRGQRGGAIDALGGFDEIGLGGGVDAGGELLRVAVDDGEPGGLHLDHDAVTLKENVVAITERDGEERGLVGL